MHEGRGPLAEDLEKFFIGSKIPYQIKVMGKESRVMQMDYGSFIRAAEDFSILSSGKYIPDADIEKIREEIKLHYISEGTMASEGLGKNSMSFVHHRSKAFVNMTPFEKEIRITVFEEREPEEIHAVVPRMQTFKM